MVGKKNGVVAKLKQENSKLLSLQCIIHQENLVAKAGIPEAKIFSDKVMKIVNKCISSGATRHRLFRQFLEECEHDITDLQKMQQVRWLSCANVFTKFLNAIGPIKEFLATLKIQFEELDDGFWIQKLSFLTDLTNKMSVLNRSLQGKRNFAWDSFKKISSFKMNIQSSIDEFENNNFDSFENLSKCSPVEKNFFLKWLRFILDDISKRFQDFQTVMFILKFGENPRPASDDDLQLIAVQFNLDYQKLKYEMNTYRSELMFNDDPTLKKFYQFPHLTKAMAHCQSLFADSYLCESAFSKMNFILNDYRANLTQNNLENCLIIATTELQIDLNELVRRLDCRVLH